MRLGQLARKYDVSLQEIVSYLKKIDPENDKLGRNSKLNDQFTALVAQHFENLEILADSEEKPVAKEETVVDADPDDPDKVSNELETPELETPELETDDQDQQSKNELVIETDKLLELLESEETSIDLSKITLIKAPKKELDGLKVVGKIELPEPRNKTVKKSEQREKEPKPDKNARYQRRQLSEEELEKRRLKAKKRKEEYQARQEKRKKEKEKKQRKTLNEARYQQKLQQTKSNQLKHRDKIQKPQLSPEVKAQRPKPKTLLGKFWRWMNT